MILFCLEIINLGFDGFVTDLFMVSYFYFSYAYV